MIIPTVRCRNLRRSLAFYTHVLDVRRVDDGGEPQDDGFAMLSRAGDLLILSTGAGDGEFGQAIVVMTSWLLPSVERDACGVPRVDRRS